MAELATIARPYAEALFKAAGADLDSTAAWVDAIAAVASDPQLKQLIGNPRVSDSEMVQLVAGVVRAPLPDLATNFLKTVVENGRLAVLPEIASQFRALKNGKTGASDAVVYSAFAMTDAALSDVMSVLEARFGRKLNISVEVVPELIGGIRVVVGDEVLDTSIKARLEQMRMALSA